MDFQRILKVSGETLGRLGGRTGRLGGRTERLGGWIGRLGGRTGRHGGRTAASWRPDWVSWRLSWASWSNPDAPRSTREHWEAHRERWEAKSMDFRRFCEVSGGWGQGRAQTRQPEGGLVRTPNQGFFKTYQATYHFPLRSSHFERRRPRGSTI